MVKREITVMIMAGGTGGHVFPALAVAKQMREQGINVHWLGTRAGLEGRLIPETGIPMSFISIKGLRGKNLMDKLFAPIRILVALFQALRVCLYVKPQVLLGMGGFVTGPGGLAGWLLRRPLVIHEQNAIPGMTNLWLSKIAIRVLEAFPDSFTKSSKVFYIGNPIRKSILKIDGPVQRYRGRSGPIRILVMGGSLGAQALNDCLPPAIAKLDRSIYPQVWHQTGRDKLISTKSLYDDMGVDVKLVEFIDDMDAAYEWADLLICRAGAMTISEISNVGIASILVPYPYAVDDHQTANAQYLCREGAAVLIQQIKLNPQYLAKELMDLIQGGRDLLLGMASKAMSIAMPHATEDVVKHCLEVAYG